MALCQYHWQGNVRELANLIERLVILYPFGVVDVNDLPEKFRAGMGSLPVTTTEHKEQPALESVLSDMSVAVSDTRLPREGINLKEHLNELEINLIRQALDEADGVVAHAAKLLNMRRTTLVEKCRKFGLQKTAEPSSTPTI
jgi:sigma-54 specific flagellar transcriptional regulator A